MHPSFKSSVGSSQGVSPHLQCAMFCNDKALIHRRENAWIQCISNFPPSSSGGLSMPRTKICPSKLPLSTTGANASLLSLDDKIVTGKSFCPYANSTDLISPYYVIFRQPRNLHGDAHLPALP